jgi:hypothetical protein
MARQGSGACAIDVGVANSCRGTAMPCPYDHARQSRGRRGTLCESRGMACPYNHGARPRLWSSLLTEPESCAMYVMMRTWPVAHRRGPPLSPVRSSFDSWGRTTDGENGGNGVRRPTQLISETGDEERGVRPGFGKRPHPGWLRQPLGWGRVGACPRPGPLDRPSRQAATELPTPARGKSSPYLYPWQCDRSRTGTCRSYAEVCPPATL